MVHTIKANRHYSNRTFPRIHFGKKFIVCNFKLVMNKNCEYNVEPHTAAYEQINKLPGFSYGFKRHQNEFQFGWRSRNGKVELFAYHWIDGEKPGVAELETSYKVCDIDFDKEYILEIWHNVNNMYFVVSENDYRTIGLKKVRYTGKSGCGWLLNPYVGGKETYNQDMTIEIDNLK